VTSAPAAAPAERTGRNDPCPCGSGRDFKQCCGAAHPAPAAENPPRNARPDRVNFGPLSEAGRRSNSSLRRSRRLPDARIIHCRRHPVDTCLSMYFTFFKERMDFARAKADLVFAYRQYAGLMEHWARYCRASVLSKSITRL
jgi:hypothetical protein